MKYSILITGAGPNGITGRRIKDLLAGKYELLYPSSRELDLTDTNAVDRYFDSHKIDYIIHSAVIAHSRGHNIIAAGNEVEDNLRMYFNLARNNYRFKKMFYFGSGAEFDKTLPIIEIREDDLISRMPKDKYGFIKYVINAHAEKSRNIYNLRLFGVINPYEPYNRNVVSNLCAKSILGLPLSLRQDCRFSFIDIDDVVAFIEYGINHELIYHSYNMSGYIRTLAEMANIVAACAGSKETPIFLKDGKSNEYTANNYRLKETVKELTALQITIEKVYNYMENIKATIDTRLLDSRWQCIENHHYKMEGGGSLRLSFNSWAA